MINRFLISTFILAAFSLSSIGECRVGGGRSFGGRGSRGFSSPFRGYPNTPGRSSGFAYPNNSQPYQQPTGINSPSYRNPSIFKSLGASIAGGLLGGMLFRSLGGGYGGGMGGLGGSGIGILEILLFAGILYLLFRVFMNQPRPSSQSSDGTAELMRQARPSEWSAASQTASGNIENLSTDIAMDLFFRIQGAWGNRDLSSVENLLDTEAKDFLDQEISGLKAAKQINRLENIAVRGAELSESWQEGGKNYSTIRFTANLLDFTIDEQTQQVVNGSKITPVKFEEFWTFSKEMNSLSWRLSAIQQN